MHNHMACLWHRMIASIPRNSIGVAAVRINVRTENMPAGRTQAVNFSTSYECIVISNIHMFARPRRRGNHASDKQTRSDNNSAKRKYCMTR